ncbi:AVL9/DENND6 domain-containing protein [Entamoeba marina]
MSIIQNIFLCSSDHILLNSYPPINDENHNYFSIPYLCFPDCGGTFLYFTVPSYSINSPLYGISVLRKPLENQFNSIVNDQEQPITLSLSVTTTSPFLHVILERLIPLADLYFTQNTLDNEDLLKTIHKTLNSSFNEVSYPLPDPCNLVTTIGKDIMLLLKMMLLDCRVCVTTPSSDDMSNWILTILSFIPGALFPAKKQFQSIGFTTQTKNTILHCPLSEFELLSNVQVFGGSNDLFKEMSEMDCVLTEKGIRLNDKYRKAITITKADKVFVQELLNAATALNYSLTLELILKYYVGVIVVSLNSKGRWVYSTDISDYGHDFLSEFKKTHFFKSLPTSLSIKYAHPSKKQVSPIDFSEYKQNQHIDVQTISCMAFPLYHKYTSSDK